MWSDGASWHAHVTGWPRAYDQGFICYLRCPRGRIVEDSEIHGYYMRVRRISANGQADRQAGRRETPAAAAAVAEAFYKTV